MCGESFRYYEDQGLFHGSVERVMGTCLDLLIINGDGLRSQTVWEECCRLLGEYESVFDRFDSGSEVSKVNAAFAKAEKMAVSDTMMFALQQCKRYFSGTGGIFDITKGGGCRYGIEGNAVSGDVGVDLDFGGYAKGFALKGILGILRKYEVENAFCDFGRSSILALGTHPAGDCWRVVLNSPYDGEFVAMYDLKDQCLSTSGNTPGYSGHIVDPRNGEAQKDKVLSTVLSSDPIEAEVLSTAVVAADLEDKEMLAGAFPTAEMHKFYL